MFNSFKKLKNSQDGMVAIVALGILALLGIFGIIIQSTTIDTVRSVKNINNYYQASDTADSVMEYLTFLAKKTDSGFNLDSIDCKYGSYMPKDSSGKPQSQNALCNTFAENLKIADQNVKISLRIKGRNATNEKFSGPCPGGMTQGCYSTPIASSGTAGNRCHLYKPNYSKTTSFVNSQGQISDTSNNEASIPQIDYSCNWNKLVFGSSLTDRATIPFYYDNGDTIINPYYNNPNGLFTVRLRTPCLPCVYDSKSVYSGETLLCTSSTTDPTICKDTERYTLNDSEPDTTPDDIIVQWQFTGLCPDPTTGKEKECGLIPYIDRDLNGKITEKSSAISDSIVNKFNKQNYIIFDPDQTTIDTNTYESDGIKFNTTFKTFKKPILTLFLSDKLISNKNKNIPYLEYQILSEQLIGASSKQLEATITVNDNIFTKTIYKEESKDLIDFAIQN